MTKIYMTDTGLTSAKKKLVEKIREYEDLCRERTLAFELCGDGWHDNPQLNRLQQLEAEKTREVRALRATVGAARLVDIDPARRPIDAVRLGSIVRLVSEREPNSTVTWQIVGFDESDIPNGLLSYNSPLGAQLIGKEKGEFVQHVSPAGVRTYEIDALFVSNEAAITAGEASTASQQTKSSICQNSAVITSHTSQGEPQ